MSKHVTLLGITILAAVVIGGRSSALGVIIYVNSNSSDQGGPGCTLRDAIVAANADHASGECPAGNGADSIVLQIDGDYLLTRPHEPGVGLPIITSELVIEGRGATVRKAFGPPFLSYRLLEIAASGNFTARDLKLRNGNLSFPSEDRISGPGGINNHGRLLLEHCEVTENTGSSVGIDNAGDPGGGIANGLGAHMTLRHTAVRGNRAGAPFFGSRGGGIANLGEAEIDECSIVGNSAGSAPPFSNGDGGSGGGIFNSGSLRIAASTIANNTAGTGGGDGGSGGNGGGIHNTGDLRVEASVLYHNAAGGGGGWAFSISPSYGGSGGAIFNSGDIDIVNSTFSDNFLGRKPSGSQSGDPVPGSDGVANGLLNFFEGRASIFNATFAGRDEITGAGLFVSNSILAAGCSVSTESGGYNLATCALSGNGDVQVGAIGLQPLADNGGPTYTHALLSGSPAIDAGDPEGCRGPDDGQLVADQRGVLRPAPDQSRCDVGAFEFGELVPSPTAAATPMPPASCPGDCDEDREVTVDEIVVLIGYALSGLVADPCPAADANDDAKIDVTDLITAIHTALSGCPTIPTPTESGSAPTPAPTSTATPTNAYR